CDVASSVAGTRMLGELAGLTGADVAASDDRTGNVGAAGDWELEYHIGAVEASLALSDAAMETYTGYLAIEIRAAGSYGNEEMQLHVGDQVVAQWTVTNTGVFDNQFESYFAEIDGV